MINIQKRLFKNNLLFCTILIPKKVVIVGSNLVRPERLELSNPKASGPKPGAVTNFATIA